MYVQNNRIVSNQPLPLISLQVTDLTLALIKCDGIQSLTQQSCYSPVTAQQKNNV